MKKTLAILLFSLSACASSNLPNKINGKYYWSGDKLCKKYKIYKEDVIECSDKKGRNINYRSAMNDSEYQIYYRRWLSSVARSKAGFEQQSVPSQNNYLSPTMYPAFTGSINP
ncbi:hypothetical protein ZMO1_ZMO2054 [Zymomonas mobilis subsp. mobilis ZM4 = ATCC 31821]|uniref:Lipoprotein n=1 Tax=Zymomonas mobilis subsp. mobilis (strain ATCC 10988 / DSM 424 / LMG 404 / NCIMB 8938 / NRRL B-806 / ZM1) TaxID=555217 RepID=A0A0H3G0Q3_ZYMMA|nr:hypothetical protein [Zymomonas mobilis]AEH62347.1 hypothetical protein Zmob_0501 [Zymomonas mobilis subsp. mobilis ATCC 10988]QIZ64066.1 hypothetical protein ZMO1_ZMO2054 [Zymomonas mobilis subsp. mobilis ZM4 = ATCC 31821]TQL28058.1 hypothetical protein FBY55_1399 [Zymomonas mobilis]TQL29993.1 hypothetical protein FBY54_0831 [Zymomonas mobilis]TWD59660.1 hypothetical protein FBY50_0455 [Zymomonas mobilis]